MNSQIRPGAIHCIPHGSAQGAAIPAYGPAYGKFRGVRLAALVAAGIAMAGCGGGADSALSTGDTPDPLQAETPQARTQQIETPRQAEPPQTDDQTDDVDTPAIAITATTVGADVLLVVPAGTAQLASSQAPTIRFKSLAGVSAQAQPLETRLRASSRIPVTADGGRSNDRFGTASSSTEAQTGSVTISWDPPLQNADGTSISDLAGYRVYQGSSDQLTIVQELNETGAGERRLAQISDVSPENACFAVTAFDTSANESALGEVVCKDIIVTGPPANDQTPDITSVTQLSSSDGVANIRLVWTPPSRSAASAGASVILYSLYHGNQSQLFKIKEVTDAATRNGELREYTVGGIGGEQACFAFTARYSDGLETLLGDIVCVPLVHSAAPQPGEQLRPYNVGVEMVGTNSAQVSWDKPNTVVSTPDATGIDRYDLYQGSPSQVYKLMEIDETGEAGSRRSTTINNVFAGSNCFALTATDDSRRQSALSTIVCASLPTPDDPPVTPPSAGTIGVTEITAQETSPGSVAIAWNAPELVAAGQPISNLSGYNLYQGSTTQLFKVAQQSHVSGAVRQQLQRTEVSSGDACFAVTAFDSNNFESPLSEIVCASISGTPSVPQFGIVPPTDLATSALGGSTTVTLSWLASGAAATGAADPNVHRYNIYQGDHDRLYKVRQVKEEHDADPRASTSFTGVAPDSACFAITAQYRDLRESRLSDIVCRDD